MDWPLYWRLPPKTEIASGKINDAILDRFLDFISSKNLELYPHQEEAILALLDDKNVILNTPTGSGKSLVALALHFQSLSLGRRSFYTCPIKALVNEKFRDLCQYFGPDQVGMITGDGSVNAQAPIICCTAEILSNLALREGERAAVDDVVMDEFHYYSDKQRGVAWQVPLLSLPQSRFLLMSATLGDMDFFAKEMTQLNGKATDIVSSVDRPVPLDYEYRETPLNETIAHLVTTGKYPIYLVNFSQREAAEEAQNLLSVDFSSKEDKKKIQEALLDVKFQSPYGKDMLRLLKHGIGLHHAGLLPKYRALVERLAQQGLLKVISGTDTLGVGVNVPIRSVLFTKLAKYDGEKSGILSSREYHQISGRAGRRGYDTRGSVIAQAPEHVIENIRAKTKAAGDPKKQKKLVTKTAPPGFVMWSKETFEKLIASKPESLVSRFQVTHGMLLSVLSRPDGRRAIQSLIRKSHGTEHSKKALRAKTFEFFRSLLDRKIVELVKQPGGRVEVRVHIELQADFSLNQILSLYLLDTLQVLDMSAPEYTLDVVTLVESILENPELILRKQLDRLKTAKMQEMKAQGMEYEERIEEFDKLEHPKPNKDFIYTTFQVFKEAHPWIGEEFIRPKSIAREMYENFHSFPEYIREYDLQRAEGILLRYLSEVYKVLEHTVPEIQKTEELREICVYFGSMIRQVDSSLLDEWEKMRRGDIFGEAFTMPPKVFDVTEDAKAFLLLVRNEMHSLVRDLANGDFENALLRIEANSAEPWTALQLEKAMAEYLQDHERLKYDPEARHPQNTMLKKEPGLWQIEQILVDSEGHNDWCLEVTIPLDLSKLRGQPVLQLIAVRAL